jgi:hypothetical protein
MEFHIRIECDEMDEATRDDEIAIMVAQAVEMVRNRQIGVEFIDANGRHVGNAWVDRYGETPQWQWETPTNDSRTMTGQEAMDGPAR